MTDRDFQFHGIHWQSRWLLQWAGAILFMASTAQAGSQCAGTWAPMGPGFSHDIHTLAVHDDGSGLAAYVGGDFMGAGDRFLLRIARWDGSEWQSVDRGVNGPAHAILSHDDGSGAALFVAGRITQPIGGPPSNTVARLGASGWTSLQPSPTDCFSTSASTCLTSYTIASEMISFDADANPRTPAELFVAGNFIRIGDLDAVGIAQWNGREWSAVGSASDGTVVAILVHDDGSGEALYAIGNFDLPGMPNLRIARWNGTEWSAVGTDVPSIGSTMTVFNDGLGEKLYVSSAPAAGLYQWDGVTWSLVPGSPIGSILVMTVLDDGVEPALYVGGLFESTKGPEQYSLARFDGVDWQYIDDLNSTVRHLLALDATAIDGPALVAAGDFTQARGVPVNRLAIRRCNGTSDLTGDGIVDSRDLAFLLDAWSIPPDAPGCAGVVPCAADINGDGLVNGFDLGILLSNWSP